MPGLCDFTRPPVLRAGGLVPLTTADFPDHLAAVIFTQGCAWACGYCQNPHLIPAFMEGGLDWLVLRRFLQRRRGLLDAVVFSGGEPLYQQGLAEAVAEVKAMGFKTGLHTAGIYPERLHQLLPQLDWVGLDIKAPFNDYPRVTGVPRSGERAHRSLEYVLESGLDYEVRTTVHPIIFNPDSLWQLASELAELGVRHYVLQAFRPAGCTNEAYRNASAEQLLQTDLCRRIASLFTHFNTRTSD